MICARCTGPFLWAEEPIHQGGKLFHENPMSCVGYLVRRVDALELAVGNITGDLCRESADTFIALALRVQALEMRGHG